ncbi:MAG: YtxH domain-containing protein [Oscillospiraceae bacterium]
MKKNNVVSSVVKGLTAGAVIGTATYMMSSSKKNNKTKIKRSASKAMRTVGTVIENVGYMLK